MTWWHYLLIGALATAFVYGCAERAANRMFNHVDVPRGDVTEPDRTAPGNNQREDR